MATYTFEVRGVDALARSWSTTGTVSTTRDGDFAQAVQEVLGESFDKLTRGDAVYGNPGVGGCCGPYRINRLTIERTW